MNESVVWHIPHASTTVPEQYKEGYCVNLEHELLKMTDLYTDDLFALPGDRLVFPVSRLVCDVERFRDDRLEEMARIGMGAVYTHCHDMSLLRNVTEEEKENILRCWYDPHHAQLTALVERKLREFDEALVIDCHSFSAVPLPYETDQNPLRPDICIGTDAFHTPRELTQTFVTEFEKLGYCVSENSPYAGAIVPLKFYRRDKRVSAVMIEVNRGLYLRENGEKSSRYQKTKADIRNVLKTVLG